MNDGSYYNSNIPYNASTTRSLLVVDIVAIIELSDQEISDNLNEELQSVDVTNNKLIATFIKHGKTIYKTYISEYHKIKTFYKSFFKAQIGGFIVWATLVLIPVLNNDIALLSGVSVFLFVTINSIFVEQPDAELTHYHRY